MSEPLEQETHCLHLNEEELVTVMAGLKVLVRVIQHKNDEKNWEIPEDELLAYERVKAIQERLYKEYDE